MVKGSITARVFTSDAEIPLRNAAVSIISRGSDGSRQLLAFRLSDFDGLSAAVAVETPELAESQVNTQGERPFTVVDMTAEQVGYDRIRVENVQVFPGIETRQDFQLIPTAELPDAYDQTELFDITEQNL